MKVKEFLKVLTAEVEYDPSILEKELVICCETKSDFKQYEYVKIKSYGPGFDLDNSFYLLLPEKKIELGKK